MKSDYKAAVTLRLWLLAPILVGYLVASVGFSIAVPVLEAPDETSHVAVVRYLSVHDGLPIQRPPGDFPAGQEGSQPPLYYILGSLLWRLAPGPALAPTFREQNPFVSFSRVATPPGNRNLYAHTPAEDYPYQGDIRAIHLVRLLSILLGVVTVSFTFLIGRELFPERVILAPLAAAIVAFDPQFVFISSVVNNDGAIAAAATVVLWCLVRWLVTGGTTGLAVALGASLGAAILAKTDGMLLAPLVAVALVANAGLTGRVRQALRWLVLVGALAAVVAGWWFVRNVVLYGDPLGWETMLAANGGMIRGAPIDALTAAQSLWAARGTFWGIFGWTNLPLSDRIYQILDVAAAIAGFGLLVTLVRARLWLDRPRRFIAFALIAVWPPLVFVSLVRWVQINNAADQWRLMFAAIGALGLLLALGLDELGWIVTRPLRFIPRNLGWITTALAITVGGTVANRAVLTTVLDPAYYPVAEAAPASAQQSPLRFGTDVELVGYQVQPARLAAGDALEVDLLWRAVRPPTRNWTVAVSLQGADETQLAKAESWPQLGRAPTTAWRVGQVYRDHYELVPRWQSPDPQLAKVWLSLYDGSIVGGPGLTVFDVRGQSLGTGVALEDINLRPTEPLSAPPSHVVSVQVGPSVDLVGDDVSRDATSLHVTLYWHDRALVGESDTVFVHIIDATGKVVAQHDGPPRDGSYPTAAWEAGDTIRDAQVVPLAGVPPGHYRVVVGLYRPTTGERLSARAASGEPIVDNGVQVSELVVP